MIRRHLRALLQEKVAMSLDQRLAPAGALAPELGRAEMRAGALDARLASAERRLASLADDLDMMRAPFSAAMTVDQAWRRHPGAAAVFAAHHLPGCDGCAVRFDETLEEAAAAYGLDLPHLLVTLNALLTPA